MAKICSNCKKENHEVCNYCENCGIKLAKICPKCWKKEGQQNSCPGNNCESNN